MNIQEIANYRLDFLSEGVGSFFSKLFKPDSFLDTQTETGVEWVKDWLSDTGETLASVTPDDIKKTTLVTDKTTWDQVINRLGVNAHSPIGAEKQLTAIIKSFIQEKIKQSYLPKEKTSELSKTILELSKTIIKALTGAGIQVSDLPIKRLARYSFIENPNAWHQSLVKLRISPTAKIDPVSDSTVWQSLIKTYLGMVNELKLRRPAPAPAPKEAPAPAPKAAPKAAPAPAPKEKPNPKIRVAPKAKPKAKLRVAPKAKPKAKLREAPALVPWPGSDGGEPRKRS